MFSFLVRIKKPNLTFLCAILFLLLPPYLAAERSLSSAHEDMSLLRISLLTGNEGDLVFNAWGHTLLFLENSEYKTRLTADYGRFMLTPYFLLHFFDGKPTYSLGIDTWQNQVANYGEQNRFVYGQSLNLSAAQKEKIMAQLRHDSLPQNRMFVYHHFTRNCTTQIRDLLNLVWDDFLFQKYSPLMSGKTFRDSGVHEVSISPLLKIVLHLFLGWHTDLPMSMYDEMFLPMRLMQNVDESRAQLQQIYGSEVVGNTQTLIYPRRHVAEPNFFRTWYLIVLLLFFLLFSFFYSRLRRQVWARRSFFLWSIFSSLIGFIIFYLHFFSVQPEFHGNMNILIFNPLNILFYFYYGFYQRRGEAKKVKLIRGLFLFFPLLSIFLRLFFWLNYFFSATFLRQPTEYFSLYVLCFYILMWGVKEGRLRLPSLNKN